MESYKIVKTVTRIILIILITFSVISLQGCFVLDWIFGVNLKAPEVVEENCCDKELKTDAYSCKECDCSFTKLKLLVKHMESEHSKTGIL